MSTLCARDGSPTGDGAVLCRTCASSLRSSLNDLADLLPDLTVAASKMTAQGPRTGTIKRTGHGDGISVHPLDVADEVRAVITPWVRALVEEQVIDPDLLPERIDNGAADTAALCRHLATRVPVIRLSDVAVDLAGDVLEAGQSLCLGYNDDGVPDTDPHYPPGEFVLANRPALADLVRQVLGMDGNAPSFREVAGERIKEAMQSFVTVEIAHRAITEAGVKVSLAKVYRVLGERDDYASKEDAEGRKTVMPDTVIELVKDHDRRVASEKADRARRAEERRGKRKVA